MYIRVILTMSKHLTDYFSSVSIAKDKMIAESPSIQPSSMSENELKTSENNDVWSTDWRLDWLKKHNPKKYKQIMGE